MTASNMTAHTAMPLAPPVEAEQAGTQPHIDILLPDVARSRERFIPVTIYALLDRLTDARAWGGREARHVRRFFRYLEHWRRQQHNADLQALLQDYEPFSPDSDLLVTREFTADERFALRKRVIAQTRRVLEQANYVEINPSKVEMILTKDSYYGLDLHVDFAAFEECLIFYRGASTKRDFRRNPKKFYRREEFDLPIFQRLFLLFKLKPFDVRVHEVMVETKLAHAEAERAVRKARSMLPPEVKEGNIYLKLFKNIPRSDVEMIFPNTRVKFRLLDKLKLGVTGGGAFGVGIFGTAGKIAAGGLAATNPVALAGAVAGLGGIAFRQAVNFMNQKQRYMVIMAQNLYFHAMADNRGVMIKLSDRAAEEDIKEEMLLYAVLARSRVSRADLGDIDRGVEQYLNNTFGAKVDFDLEDALSRLIADGMVQERPDGTLETLAPAAAAQHLDSKWDVFLDNLVSDDDAEGAELASAAGGRAS